MRLFVKQFESICQDQSELGWDGVCCPISPTMTKHNLLLAAVHPFIEAAKQIPEGTSPDDTLHSVFPPVGLFIEDFYRLVAAVNINKKGS